MPEKTPYQEHVYLAMRDNYARYIQEHAIVVNQETGFVVCEDVNHVVDPYLLRQAAEITYEGFIRFFLGKLPHLPRIVCGVPNRGREYATAIGITAGIPIAVTERIIENKPPAVSYDSKRDVVEITGIPSFTQKGRVFTHTVRGLRPGDTVLVADDFCAYGHVALQYQRLTELGIKPVFSFMVAKDFQDLPEPQEGYRNLLRQGVLAFAATRLTNIVNNGNGNYRVIATSQDIKL
jgi:adenine/guanine phosphoribosyltransferase-like PRPP-binding protein